MRGAPQEIRRLAETFRLEVVKIESQPETGTTSAPTEAAASDIPSEKGS
jgi:hypothetical protein